MCKPMMNLLSNESHPLSLVETRGFTLLGRFDVGEACFFHFRAFSIKDCSQIRFWDDT